MWESNPNVLFAKQTTCLWHHALVLAYMESNQDYLSISQALYHSTISHFS